MKWYFACNDRSQRFFPLIKGAVNSAIENTSLEPHFIYDGEENELTDWLRAKGVNVIHHRVSFYDALEKHYSASDLNTASGAFLRCDIPIIEKDDDFVLYTDCDVLFLKDFELPVKPKYFACSSQFTKRNFIDFNTGVMVMNVRELQKSHQQFSDFISNNLHSLQAFDQGAYQTFYNTKNTKLPVAYNHKPYWGVDDNAVILHFHGAKPVNFASDDFLSGFPYDYDVLYRKTPSSYDFYLNLFRTYYSEIEYNLEAIEKLKQGVYPLIKVKKSFKSKVKNRVKKGL